MEGGQQQGPADDGRRYLFPTFLGHGGQKGKTRFRCEAHHDGLETATLQADVFAVDAILKKEESVVGDHGKAKKAWSSWEDGKWTGTKGPQQDSSGKGWGTQEALDHKGVH